MNIIFILFILILILGHLTLYLKTNKEKKETFCLIIINILIFLFTILILKYCNSQSPTFGLIEGSTAICTGNILNMLDIHKDLYKFIFGVILFIIILSIFMLLPKYF